MLFWTNQLILHGGLFALVLAANTALARGIGAQRRLVVTSLLLCCALYQIAYALPRMLPGPIEYALPVPEILLVLAVMGLGPLNFAYFSEMLADERRPRSSPILRWLPVLLAIATGLIALELSVSNAARGGALVYTGAFSVALFMALHVILAGRLIRLVRSHPANRTGMPGYALLCAGITLGLALLWFASRLWSVDTRPAIHVAVTAYTIGLFLFSQRYPRFLLAPRIEQVRERYRKTALGEVDVAATVARLTQLMEHERLYALEDLSLAQLAAELGLSSHQLSELLNSHLQRSFSGFVNEHRIREACRLLKAEPERSVLAIGLAVGFNSSSAFYKAFQTWQGMSPARFSDRAA